MENLAKIDALKKELDDSQISTHCFISDEKIDKIHTNQIAEVY
jgi:hypothetical protein